MLGKNFLPPVLLIASVLMLMSVQTESQTCTPADSDISDDTYTKYTDTVIKNCVGSKGNKKKEFNQCKKEASFSYDTSSFLKTCKSCSFGREPGLPFSCGNLVLPEDKEVFDCVLAEIKKEVAKKDQTVDAALDANLNTITQCCETAYNNGDCQ